MCRQPVASQRLSSQRRNPAERRAEASQAEAECKLDSIRHDNKEALNKRNSSDKLAKAAQEALDAATKASYNKSQKKIKSADTLERHTLNVQLELTKHHIDEQEPVQVHTLHGRVTYEMMCARAHVPVWEALGEQEPAEWSMSCDCCSTVCSTPPPLASAPRATAQMPRSYSL